MQLILWCIVVLVSTGACGSAPEPASDPVDVEVRSVEAEVRQLSADWEELTQAFAPLAARYRTSRTASATSSAHDVFAIWELYREVLKLARTVGTASTCKRVPTAAFRKQLRAQGVDLTGKDIDHIVPRAHGGVDDPANYQVIDSSLNRSLGKTWNLDKCLMPGRQRCIEAIAVTVKCGVFRGGFF